MIVVVVFEQVGEAASKVHVPPFAPRKGVRIETDPKADKAAPVTAVDDDSVSLSCGCQWITVGSMHIVGSPCQNCMAVVSYFQLPGSPPNHHCL